MKFKNFCQRYAASFVLFFSSFSAYASVSYFVAPIEGDLSPSQNKSFRGLTIDVLSSLSDEGVKIVSQEQAANYILVPSFQKLEHNFIASMRKCNGNTVHDCKSAGSLKISSLDEADVAIRRLTIAAIDDTQVSSEAAGKVGLVTNLETNSLRRSVKAKRLWRAGLGGGALLGLSEEASVGSYGFLLGWQALVSPHFAVDVSWQMQLNKDNNPLMTMIGVGPQYYFSGDDWSPYVRASLNYFIAQWDKNIGFNVTESQEGQGIAAGLSAGVTLFRTSDVNMFAEVSSGMGFSKVAGKVPSSISFLMGISF